MYTCTHVRKYTLAPSPKVVADPEHYSVLTDYPQTHSHLQYARTYTSPSAPTPVALAQTHTALVSRRHSSSLAFGALLGWALWQALPREEERRARQRETQPDMVLWEDAICCVSTHTKLADFKSLDVLWL